VRHFLQTQSVSDSISLGAVGPLLSRYSVAAISLLLLLGFSAPQKTFAQPASFPLTATVGSGPDESFLVINFGSGPGETNVPGDDVAFGYLWGGSNNLDPTSWNMIDDISNAGIGFSNTNENYGPGLGHYVFGFSFDGLSNGSPIGTFSDPDGNFWNYYQAGDQNSSGYPIPSTDNVSSAEVGTWSYSYWGPDQLNLTDGSVDGWVFDPGLANPALPSAGPAAAPEASSWVSMLAGGALIVGLFWTKRHAAKGAK
jgi:hypothetical protein